MEPNGKSNPMVGELVAEAAVEAIPGSSHSALCKALISPKSVGKKVDPETGDAMNEGESLAGKLLSATVEGEGRKKGGNGWLWW